jgi:hypothetical protein
VLQNLDRGHYIKVSASPVEVLLSDDRYSGGTDALCDGTFFESDRLNILLA